MERLRLEWDVQRDGLHIAEVPGALRLFLQVDRRGSFRVLDSQNMLACGDEKGRTILAAQLAAEAAALDLLTSTVAAFGVRHENAERHGDVVFVASPYDGHTPAEAVVVACALLAAAAVKP